MSSSTSRLLDLPLVLFRQILAEAVQMRGLKRALRLRLVSRVFAIEICEVFWEPLTNRWYNAHFKVRDWPFLREQVEARLVAKRTQSFPVLHTVRTVAEVIAAREEHRGGGLGYEACALKLLQLACDVHDLSAQRLFCREDVHYHYKKRLANARNCFEEEEWAFRGNLLSAAAFLNDVPLVEELLADFPVYPGTTLGQDPYTGAVVAGNLDVIALLGIDPREENLELLQAAGRYGDLETVRYMLKHSCLSALSRFTRECRHTLRRDHLNAHLLALGFILKTPSVPVFNLLFASLHSQMNMTFNCELRDVLVKHAVEEGWPEMTQHLIDISASLGLGSKYPVGVVSEYKLNDIIKRGHTEVVKVLIDHGSQAYVRQMCTAARYGQASTLRHILDSCRALYLPERHLCACYYNNGCVLRDRYMRCVSLYEAARKGRLDIVRMLLDAGANPNANVFGKKNDRSRGIAPLVGAVESESVAIFHLLVQRGANVAAVLHEARKAAKGAGLESMLALLQDYDDGNGKSAQCENKEKRTRWRVRKHFGIWDSDQ